MSIEKMRHTLVAYEPAMSRQWDAAVLQARNGHFMFCRGYMDYHVDRFADCSFVLLRGNRVVALLPAHRQGEELVSHGGLTFGGWLQMPGCRHADLERGFDLLAARMRTLGLGRLVYQPAPYPYFAEPGESDTFILATLGARPGKPRLGAFIQKPAALVRNAEFRRRLRHAESACPGEFMETDDVERFWGHLAMLLEVRHQAAPVHSAAEMRLLKERFPKNIRLFVLQNGDDWLSGEVAFLSRRVLRLQYGFYCLDRPGAITGIRIQERLRQHFGGDCEWMDLGTSMEPQSGELMETLHLHKENFGARSIALTRWVWEPCGGVK